MERDVTPVGLPPPPEQAAERPFSTAVAAVVGVGAAASLILAFLLLVFRSEQLDESTVGNDSYSISSLGHHLLHELLRTTGRPVARSRHRSAARAARSLLVLAEPRQRDLDAFQKIVAEADTVLCVLQKRTGSANAANAAWIEEHALCDLDVPGRFLAALAAGASVRRPDAAGLVWQSLGDLPDLPAPTIDDLQLLSGRGFRPLLRCGDGTLLAEIRRGPATIYVLSDPDAFANHGIDDGENAAFALGLLDALRKNRTIVLDETLHGFAMTPSVWDQLGRFPLVLVLANVFLLLFAVVWAAIGRFGPVHFAAQGLAGSKQFLLDNTANLMIRSGNTITAVRHYFRDSARGLARLDGERDLRGPQVLAAAQRRAKRAGLGDEWRAIGAAVEALTAEGRDIHPRRAIEMARRIHHACEEIAHGSR